MWSRLAKLILALTSFAPLLFVITVDLIIDDKTLWLSLESAFQEGHKTDLTVSDKTKWAFFWFIVTIVLGFVCWRMMKFGSERGAATHTFEIKEFNRRDQGILVFMFIYLLPVIRSPNTLYFADWIIGVIVFVVIIITTIDIGAFNFNPVIRIFGYRVYEIKDTDDVHHLLITRRTLRKPGDEVQVRRISHDVYVQMAGDNA